MSLYYVTLISAYSMALPSGTAIWRFKALQGKYLPLLILVGVGLLNEVYSSFAAHYKHSNAINGNCYVLIEYLLIIWLFTRLTGRLSRYFIAVITILGIGAWVADNLVLHSLDTNNSIFRLVASMCIVCTATSKTNQLLLSEGPVLFKHPDLLLCLAFFSYFFFKTFVEVFNLYEMPVLQTFYYVIWSILSVINVLMNIFIAIAILCIPPKQESFIRSSP